MRFRIISLGDVKRHPARSFAVEDYIFPTGGRVTLRRSGEERIVVRQDGNDLWLAKIEYVPGTKTAFCCTLTGEQTTIFGVRRARR